MRHRTSIELTDEQYIWLQRLPYGARKLMFQTYLQALMSMEHRELLQYVGAIVSGAIKPDAMLAGREEDANSG